MLAQGPHGHLGGAARHEDQHGRALRHDAERGPGADFVRVVWARDQIEQWRERVRVRVGDFSDLKFFLIIFN